MATAPVGGFQGTVPCLPSVCRNLQSAAVLKHFPLSHHWQSFETFASLFPRLCRRLCLWVSSYHLCRISPIFGPHLWHHPSRPTPDHPADVLSFRSLHQPGRPVVVAVSTWYNLGSGDSHGVSIWCLVQCTDSLHVVCIGNRLVTVCFHGV